ncbi:hypothetical protein BG005_000986 [Podila minutissima]|nr:hypothetical protein BG005_000986 [Podila minutissima]
MAYAMLESLPPVYGLYTSLVPTTIYAILGTRRHMTTGNFAITSLLLGQFAHKILSEQGYSESAASDEYHRRYIPLCLVLTFLIGGIQIVLSVVRLGRWTSKHLLPVALVFGFNTASAFHIGTYQLKLWLGVKPPRESGVFSMFKIWAWIIDHFWAENSWPTLAMDLAGIILMYILQQIEYCHRSTADLALVFTAATAIFDLDTQFGIEVIGYIPTGLPTPAWLPQLVSSWTWSELTPLIRPSFFMAIVVYVMFLSVAKHFGREYEYEYEVDADQEILAIGVGSLVGSCFGRYVCTGNLTRSTILEQLNAKTPLASLVGALVLLATLLWFTVLFEHVPNTILVAIVLVASKSLMGHTFEARKRWRVGRRKEEPIWWITFISVLVFSIEISLGIGIVTVILLKVYKNPGRWKKAMSRAVVQSVWYQQLMLMLGLQSPLFMTGVERNTGDEYLSGMPSDLVTSIYMTDEVSGDQELVFHIDLDRTAQSMTSFQIASELGHFVFNIESEPCDSDDTSTVEKTTQFTFWISTEETDYTLLEAFHECSFYDSDELLLGTFPLTSKWLGKYAIGKHKPIIKSSDIQVRGGQLGLDVYLRTSESTENTPDMTLTEAILQDMFWDVALDDVFFVFKQDQAARESDKLKPIVTMDEPEPTSNMDQRNEAVNDGNILGDYETGAGQQEQASGGNYDEGMEAKGGGVGACTDILSRWPHFWAMIKNRITKNVTGRNEVWIKDVNETTFEAMLYYMYVGTLPLKDINMLKKDDSDSFSGRCTSWESLYIAAHQYRIDHLRRLACKVILDGLDKSDAIPFIFRTAYRFEELRRPVVKLIAEKCPAEMAEKEIRDRHRTHPEFGDLVGELYAAYYKLQ